MQHTAEEEEALVPLVRNRRHRARARDNTSITSPPPPAADKEQAIEVPGDVKTRPSCGRGVSARVRDMFHVRDGSSRQLYAMISLEVSSVINVMSLGFLSLFICRCCCWLCVVFSSTGAITTPPGFTIR